MTKTTLSDSSFIIFGIPLLFILSCVILVQVPAFVANQNILSNAITLDLLLSTPFIYYLLIRNKKIPKTTVVPVFILGIVIGSLIIPKENQHLLQSAKTWILPFVEIGVLLYIGFKIYKTVQLFKEKKNLSTDFFTIAKNVCKETFEDKLAIILATEIAVIYYVFFNWKKKKLNKNEFSYHKNTGSITLLVAVVFLIFIETVILHILLMKWNIIIAWIVSGISIYTAIQIFAILKSISKRPIYFEKDLLYLRYGMLSETTIAIENIKSVELSTKEIEKEKRIQKLSPLGDIEGHNIIIHLNEKNILNRFYGLNKKYTSIVFFVDDKNGFMHKLNLLINS